MLIFTKEPLSHVIIYFEYFKSHFDPFDSCFCPVLIRPAQCVERERPWCARGKGAPVVRAHQTRRESKEIKKFVTNERIAEKVSLFGYMFYSFTSITGANLGPIQKTRFDTLAIKKTILKRR